jgi:hypothetical protein
MIAPDGVGTIRHPGTGGERVSRRSCCERDVVLLVERLSRGRSSPGFDPELSTDAADQVRDLLGCPVLVENEANLGTVGIVRVQRLFAVRAVSYPVHKRMVRLWCYRSSILLSTERMATI